MIAAASMHETSPMKPSASRAAGFTLIELMIALVIVAILITVGIPSLTEFVASQRLRTLVADVTSDVAFARAEAIKESRQVIMERLAGGATNSWKDGWRICVDLNRDTVCDANEIRKMMQPVGGRIRVCSLTNTFRDRIVFRPDGRLVLAAGPAANEGITFSDDMGDGDATNDLIKTLSFGIAGRPLTVRQQDSGTGGVPINGGALCP
jgi:prepilin-type N-terminal cleavage/methylation domain-containing protein